MKSLKNLLKKLCTIKGISGSEENVAKYIYNYLKDKSCINKINIDKNGNVICKIKGNENSKTILLDAHIDQIGMVVTHIEKDGFLRVAKVGGVDPRTLIGTEVIIKGEKNILGIVASTPPHLLSGKEDEVVQVEELLIDTGLNFEKLKNYVDVGDPIYFNTEPLELLNNKIAAQAIDNRAGVAVLLECINYFEKTKNIPYNIIFLFSTQEETFGKGAKTGAFSIEADESIAVDVSFALQKDIGNYHIPGVLGKGSMICFGSTINQEMSNKLLSIGKDEEIPYQLEVCGRGTGTNADYISVSKSGVKTALLSVPIKYMHTQVEVVKIDDIKATANLICEYISQGGINNA